MFSFLKRIFGTAQSRTVQRYRSIVDEINKQEEAYQSLSDDDIKAKTAEFKKRIQEGTTPDDLLIEAYAVVKSACRRMLGQEFHVSGYDQKWDMVPFDVQIIGAIALHKGYISEMQTGEGKTITAVMPLYLNALTGKPVHCITSNDYLAKRDCEWTGSVLRWLGLTTGVISQAVPYEDRSPIYGYDIVYGTASEFGFDYLRDNSIAQKAEEQVIRGFHFCLIDEVDSILIDEARTPLIISGPAGESKQLYEELKDPVARLVAKQKDYCQRLALDAKKALDSFLKDEADLEDKQRDLTDEEKEGVRKLWIVERGTPRNKILKRLRENPDIRLAIDQWDLFYWADPNKDERTKVLSDLYIIVDEKANEYELTDKGILTWATECGGHEDDFVMLDLGHEFLLIDQNHDLSKEDKMEKKLQLHDEDATRKERAHNLRQLFRAHLLMEKDVDYIVQNEKVIIIDENTGRPQPGRRFSDGLHQAIEAKEGSPIQRETQTFATITLQNFFRMYDKLAGMTGTAITEAREFKEIYKLDVLQIPTNKPCIRDDANDLMYMTEREKFGALITEIKAIHEKGCPILVGTESVEVSEKLSRILKINRMDHAVLNAKNHANEALVIAAAGQQNAITISTNMAGRGTDIKLGAGIAEKGGLHVVGTTRHQSQRIDLQLKGRAGRQGDPGVSKFFISLEDPLMRLFASSSMTSLLQRFRPPEGEPISAPILDRSIRTAQKRIEQRNAAMRKHTLEYDDVMNKQRQEIYAFRHELLSAEHPQELAKEVLENLIVHASEEFFSGHDRCWDPEGFRLFLLSHFPVSFEEGFFDDERAESEELAQKAFAVIFQAFQDKIVLEIEKAKLLARSQDFDADPIIDDAVRSIMVTTIDQLWKEHLLHMDHLRSDVNLRSVAQKDPLMEFKEESFKLFDQFTQHLRIQMAQTLFKFEIIPTPEAEMHRFLQQLQLETDRSFVSELETNSPQTEEAPAPRTVDPKQGRNEPCPCGSGKKFKKCCGQ